MADGTRAPPISHSIWINFWGSAPVKIQRAFCVMCLASAPTPQVPAAVFVSLRTSLWVIRSFIYQPISQLRRDNQVIMGYFSILCCVSVCLELTSPNFRVANFSALLILSISILVFKTHVSNFDSPSATLNT